MEDEILNYRERNQIGNTVRREMWTAFLEKLYSEGVCPEPLLKVAVSHGSKLDPRQCQEYGINLDTIVVYVGGRNKRPIYLMKNMKNQLLILRGTYFGRNSSLTIFPPEIFEEAGELIPPELLIKTRFEIDRRISNLVAVKREQESL
jgi:hypothetical protein